MLSFHVTGEFMRRALRMLVALLCLLILLGVAFLLYFSHMVRTLDAVADRHDALTDALRQSPDATPSADVLAFLDRSEAERLFLTLSPWERRGLRRAICIRVKRSKDSRHLKSRPSCTNPPEGTHAGDFLCRSSYPPDAEDMPPIDEFYSTGTRMFGGCLITTWSRQQGEWRLDQVLDVRPGSGD
nr:hypothetical protein [uncultured Hyphomonas sp.]